jgi:predicted ester cyclase
MLLSALQQSKHIIGKFCDALYDCHLDDLKTQIEDIFSPNCKICLPYPFEYLKGSSELYELAYKPLLYAAHDLERRDFIRMAGECDDTVWVGCAGHYIGVFTHPWLDIPPTGRPSAMRYHEFFRIEGDHVVEMQAVWDIPELMMQAHVWPMTPSLGVEWLVPGPATQDGIVTSNYDQESSDRSLKLVKEMLIAMGRHPQQGSAEVMELDRYWHPKMLWYGPAGIGTARGISGFRKSHQIPFLKAMPDRRVIMGEGIFFSENNYVAFTAWPGMRMTVSGDGWLGIAPSDKEITMRSLDFWRCQNGKIRENWVLIDLLHMYNQIGVDVFSRMREITHAGQER